MELSVESDIGYFEMDVVFNGQLASGAVWRDYVNWTDRSQWQHVEAGSVLFDV